MARRNNRQHAMLHSILLVISVSLLRSVMGAQQLHAGSATNIQGKVEQAPFDQKESHSDLEVVSTQAAEQDGGNSDSSSSTFAVSRRRLGQGPVATGSFTSITSPLRVCGNDPTVSNADLTNQVMGSGRSLKSFMDQCSFGSLNFDTSPDNNLIVSTPVPINSVCSGNSVNCNNIDGIGQEAEDWLSNNGYDMTKYSVRILVFPANMPGCPRIGVGRWGCFTNNPGPGTPALICRTWITNGDVVGLIHETGHNLGLSHANLGSQDAGDMTSPMGYTGDYRCHNAYQASLLNWVKPVQTINLNDVSGGQWKNVQLPPRVNSQKNFILLQGSGNDLYVSYTAPVGWEKDVNPADSYQLLVHSQMSDSDWSRSNLLARLNNNQRASISKWVIRVTSTSANGATAQICRQENNGQCQPGTEPSGSASTTNKPKSTPKRELSAEATANSEEKSPQKKLSPRPPPKAAQKKPSPRPPRPPPRKTKA